MELQELVERINRWKMRQAGELPEDAAPEFTSEETLNDGFMTAASKEMMSPAEKTAEDFAAPQYFGGEAEYAAAKESNYDEASMSDHGFDDNALAEPGGTDPAIPMDGLDAFGDEEIADLEIPAPPTAVAPGESSDIEPPPPPVAVASAEMDELIAEDTDDIPAITTHEVETLDFIEEEK
ncbi:MAG: hypothetical protein JXR76_18520 [Deltaproteobacteria bacterium]|nr:hypothetical protein [Deltaproteobacteria bacterium]